MKLFRGLQNLGKRKCAFEFVVTIHGLDNVPGDRMPAHCRCIRGNRKHDTKVAISSERKVTWSGEQFTFTGTLFEIKSNKGVSYSRKELVFKIRAGTSTIGERGGMTLYGKINLANFTSRAKELFITSVAMKEKRRKRNDPTAPVMLKLSIQCQAANESPVLDGSDSEGSRVSDGISGFSELETPRSDQVSQGVSSFRSPSREINLVKPKQSTKTSSNPLATVTETTDSKSIEKSGNANPPSGNGANVPPSTKPAPTLQNALQTANASADKGRSRGDAIDMSIEAQTRSVPRQSGNERPPRLNTSPPQRDSGDVKLEGKSTADVGPGFGITLTKPTETPSNTLSTSIEQHVQALTPTTHLARPESHPTRVANISSNNLVRPTVSGDHVAQIQQMALPQADFVNIFGSRIQAPSIDDSEHTLDNIIHELDSPETNVRPGTAGGLIEGRWSSIEHTQGLKTAPPGRRQSMPNRSFVWSKEAAAEMTSVKKSTADQSLSEPQLKANAPVSPAKFSVSGAHSSSEEQMSFPRISNKQDSLEATGVLESETKVNESLEENMKENGLESDGVAPGDDGEQDSQQLAEELKAQTELQKKIQVLCDKVVVPCLKTGDSKLHTAGEKEWKNSIVHWFWNTVAIMPVVVMRALKAWRAFEPPRHWAVSHIVAKIKETMDDCEDPSQQIGGLSHISLLMHLMRVHSSKPSKHVVYDAKKICEKCVEELRKIGEQIFGSITSSFLRLMPGVTCKVMCDTQNDGADLECPMLLSVYLTKCEAILGMLRSQFVSPSLQSQFIQRIFRQFTSSITNSLLLDPENEYLCDAEGGLALKIVLSTIDAWCVENAPNSKLFEQAKEELEPLRDICNLLLLGKGVKSTPIRGLNMARLERLAQRYNKQTRNENDRISGDDLRAIRLNRGSTSYLRAGDQKVQMLARVSSPVQFAVAMGRLSLDTVPLPQSITSIEEFDFLRKVRPVNRHHSGELVL
mmetsp:Transcript_29058/g.70882  ORF Transcript_29058/g.70882 Transcript_29058/m.70882 type:complete len:976 (-) Transcript_29058:172-3099(-)|eukprot:CAMPEP_0114496542 /NCGR_PEP_ID=MMETSP0109-20121206/5827_1 /TAXON_ID=29199 /ORGANISM="Chlorarachnion reptans, Strain CCCM449" /LENGTH=975 /DNA_ID=CAMNT_0001673825 /DNA_START=199 /DNA_END=3126 /DNA_ORIENTATION=+